MSYVPDYAGAPGDLDGVLAHLLHGAVAADVKEVGLKVLTVAAWVSSNQEQRTPGVRAENFILSTIIFMSFPHNKFLFEPQYEILNICAT